MRNEKDLTKELLEDLYHGFKDGILLSSPKQIKSFPMAILDLFRITKDSREGCITIYYDKKPKNLYGMDVQEFNGKTIYSRKININI